MKVMVLVKATKDSEAGSQASGQLLTEMGRFNEALADAGVLLSGEGLHPSSRGVRVRLAGAERTVVPGSFVATPELVSGFWVWKVASIDEAIAWALRIPSLNGAPGEVELRPVLNDEDFGPEFTPELREQGARLRARSDPSRKPDSR
jgi:hypothetical protein